MNVQPQPPLRFSAINVAFYRHPNEFGPHYDLQLNLTGKDRLQGADRTELTRIKYEPDNQDTPFSVYAQPGPEKPGHWVKKYSKDTLRQILAKLQTETLHFTRDFRKLITKGRPEQKAGDAMRPVTLPKIDPIGLEKATADIREIAGIMLNGLSPQ